MDSLDLIHSSLYVSRRHWKRVVIIGLVFHIFMIQTGCQLEGNRSRPTDPRKRTTYLNLISCARPLDISRSSNSCNRWLSRRCIDRLQPAMFDEAAGRRWTGKSSLSPFSALSLSCVRKQTSSDLLSVVVLSCSRFSYLVILRLCVSRCNCVCICVCYWSFIYLRWRRWVILSRWRQRQWTLWISVVG